MAVLVHQLTKRMQMLECIKNLIPSAATASAISNIIMAFAAVCALHTWKRPNKHAVAYETHKTVSRAIYSLPRDIRILMHDLEKLDKSHSHDKFEEFANNYMLVISSIDRAKSVLKANNIPKEISEEFPQIIDRFVELLSDLWFDIHHINNEPHDSRAYSMIQKELNLFLHPLPENKDVNGNFYLKMRDRLNIMLEKFS